MSNEPQTHLLKTWPEPFRAVLEGRKRYEVRVNDRDFKVGDVLRLREWDPMHVSSKLDDDRRIGYSGRVINARVTYMTNGGEFGLPKHMCVMSIDVVSTEVPLD